MYWAQSDKLEKTLFKIIAIGEKGWTQVLLNIWWGVSHCWWTNRKVLDEVGGMVGQWDLWRILIYVWVWKCFSLWLDHLCLLIGIKVRLLLSHRERNTIFLDDCILKGWLPDTWERPGLWNCQEAFKKSISKDQRNDAQNNFSKASVWSEEVATSLW